MTWTTNTPCVPGRYWWRHMDQYGRTSYGLALIGWNQTYSPLHPSTLAIRSVIIMGNNYGHDERELGGHWALSGSVPGDVLGGNQTAFWSEPLLNGPPGINYPVIDGQLPPLPDCPPAPSPEEIQKEKARESARAKRSKREDRKRHKERDRRIADAITEKRTLYECEGCEALVDKGDLVACRECPHCSTHFVSDDRECPDCNRPFTRIEHKLACLTCESAEECTVIVENGNRVV